MQKSSAMKEKNIKIEPRICVQFMFELNDECIVIKNKTLVIKEIHSWLL